MARRRRRVRVARTEDGEWDFLRPGGEREIEGRSDQGGGRRTRRGASGGGEARGRGLGCCPGEDCDGGAVTFTTTTAGSIAPLLYQI
jgi:hypothetical protein